MKYIEELTEGEVTMGPATLYTLIKKMQEAGFILLVGEEDERRKTYSITEKGRSVVMSEIERRSRMAGHGLKALQSVEEAKTDEEE